MSECGRRASAVEPTTPHGIPPHRIPPLESRRSTGDHLAEDPCHPFESSSLEAAKEPARAARHSPAGDRPRELPRTMRSTTGRHAARRSSERRGATGGPRGGFRSSPVDVRTRGSEGGPKGLLQRAGRRPDSEKRGRPEGASAARLSTSGLGEARGAEGVFRARRSTFRTRRSEEGPKGASAARKK